MPTNSGKQLPTNKAVRLIFEYEGDTVRLVHQQNVDMAVTGYDMPDGDHPAHYVDTRDAKDKTLARVTAPGAFSASAEVFPERHGDPITRVEIAKPKGAFTVVVPVTDAADHVTVVKVAHAPPAKGAKGVAAEAAQPIAHDVASFPLAGSHPKNSGGAQ